MGMGTRVTIPFIFTLFSLLFAMTPYLPYHSIFTSLDPENIPPSTFVLPFVLYLLYSTTRTLPYHSDSRFDSSMFVLVYLQLCSLYYINPTTYSVVL